MRILIVGSGAREHALAWKILHSPKAHELLVAPGNAGTDAIACKLDIPPTDIPALTKAAQEKEIDLVVVGPEAPLSFGIVDALQEAGIAAFGPSKEATRIESSKVFAKELMQRYGIPCARSASFASFSEAKAYLNDQPTPIVVKADGLAAGKGAIVATSRDQALEALSDMMEKRVFGEAGDRVLIEECLTGREASLMAFTDGETVIPMIPACDYKRALDGDHGPNTGGMGGYSPPEFFTPHLASEATETILKPAVRAMSREGKPFRGVLYAGLMITPEGPRVLEFNARLGDPETQVTLPLLKSDLVDIMWAVVNGTLAQTRIEWSDDACVGVVLASGGYPGSYQTGFPVNGLDSIDRDTLVFHAGTRQDEVGRTVTAGGRVLTVVGIGRTCADARDRVYRNLPRVSFNGCHHRRDIARQAIEPQGVGQCL